MTTETPTDESPTTNGHAPAAADDGDGPDVQDVRGALKAHLGDTGRSMSAAARAMGRSPGAISRFLGGKYRGDNAAVARDVQSYLRRETERDRRKREGAIIGDTGYVETQAFRRVHQIARICHMERDIGVLCAEAGTGKTVAAEAYAEAHSGVIFIEVDPGFTAKATMQEIARAVGAEEQGTLYAITRRVYKRLEGSGQLLIVDEAESLPVRALELLRRIHDRAGAGVLLVGLERLLHNLRGSASEFKQLWSRVGVKARLDAGLDEDDTRRLVAQALPEADAQALTEAVREVTTGARTTAKLLRRAASLADMNDKAQVTPAAIEKAKRLLIV